MARLTDITGGGHSSQDEVRIEAHGQETISVPHPDFIANAEILRDGPDLILRNPDGGTFVVEGYFNASPVPTLVSAQGAALTPQLVQSFVQSAPEYAQAETANDESPVGTAGEVSGKVTVTRTDGTVETLSAGMPVFEGDIIETDAEGAVNILFLDETSFAVSGNAKLSIDEYVFDPATGSGESNFSVLRGMFVFVSGLIGRDDPDDVEITTPVGSIGIRGTTIAGNVDTGEITVIEGAIVMRSLDGRSEMTLATQFETARFNTAGGTIDNTGVRDGSALGTQFMAMQAVVPAFFASIGETAPANAQQTPAQGTTDAPANGTAPAGETQAAPEGTAPEAAPVLPASPPPTGYNESSFDGGNAAGFETSAGATPPVTGGAATQPSLATGLGAAASAPPPSTEAAPPTTAAPSAADTGTNLAPPPPPPAVIGGTNAGGGGGTTTPAAVANDLDLQSAFGPLNGYRLLGTAGEHFGLTVAALGDYNGDGLADFAVGNNPGGSQGSIDIFVANGTLASTQNINFPSNSDIDGVGDVDGDGVVDFIGGSGTAAGNDGYMIVFRDGGAYTSFSNMGTDYQAGSSVAGVGDINGDGYNDFMIGAPNAPDAGANMGSGKAILVFGSSTLPTFLEYGDTSPVDGTPDFVNDMQGTIIVGAPTLRLGTDVAGAGDFDNDGYADIMYSTPGDGKAYIRYGEDNAFGLAATGTVIVGMSSTNDDIPLFNMGDVNGDGISDIGLGDLDTDGGRGVLHVLYGGNGNPTGINVGGTLTAAEGFSLRLAPGAGEFTSGGNAGDFNGDGLDDIAVAIRNGAMIDIYVLYGNPNMNGNIILDRSVAGNILNNINESFHMSYSLANEGLANPATDEFDLEILSPGDANGDGRDDLVIGAELANGGAGEAIIVYGRDNHNATTSGTAVTATGANQSLVGTTGADVMSNGTFNGVSFNAGAGDDLIRLGASGGIRNIDGGAGFDTLFMESTRTSLDFSIMGSERLSGIERITMQGTGQTLTLGIDDIFRLMQESSDGILRIDAATAGSFSIEDNTGGVGTMAGFGFGGASPITENGTTYNAFDFGTGYQLYVEDTAVTMALV